MTIIEAISKKGESIGETRGIAIGESIGETREAAKNREKMILISKWLIVSAKFTLSEISCITGLSLVLLEEIEANM